MAITLADAIVAISGDASQLDEDFDGSEKKTKSWVKGLSGTVSGLVGGVMRAGIVGLTGAVVGIGAAVTKFTLDAAAVQGVTDTFETLVASVGGDAVDAMDQLRDATRGMISDADLMTAGNKFLAMGISSTVEEAAALAEVATQLGSAMGEDATASMENFALMMANQSVPRLDSFGISSGVVKARIAELTVGVGALSKEAAFNQAVMEQAEITMAKVGEQGDNMAGSMGRLKAFMSNLSIGIGQAFIPIGEKLLGWFARLAEKFGPPVLEWFTEAGRLVNGFITTIVSLSQGFSDLGWLSVFPEWMAPIITAIVDVIGWFESLTPVVNTLLFAFESLMAGDIDLFWGLITAALHELGVPIEFIDKMREYSEAVGTYWNGTLQPAIVKLWDKTLKPALEGLWQLLVDLTPIIIAFGVAVLAFIVAPMVLAAMPVIALGIALIGLGLLWNKHGEEVKQIVTQIGVIIAHVFGNAIDWIITFIETLASGGGFWADFLGGLGIDINGLLDGLGNAQAKLEEMRNAGIASVTSNPVQSQFDPSIMGGFGGLFEQLFGQGDTNNSRAFTNYGGIQQFGFGDQGSAIEDLWEQAL